MGSDPRPARIAAPNARPLGSLPIYSRRPSSSTVTGLGCASCSAPGKAQVESWSGTHLTQRSCFVTSPAVSAGRDLVAVLSSTYSRQELRRELRHAGSIACWLLSALGGIAESCCGRRSVIVNGPAHVHRPCHHASDCRAALGSVKARRYARPALRLRP